MIAAETVRELRQYNIEFDWKEKETEFIKTQLKTHLKERFNVLVSQAEYAIINGHLVRAGTTEPFINSIKRGRDLIQRLSQNTLDVYRENAEVEGFENITDPFLSDPTTSLDSKVLSISPKGEEGSKYQHNFYDIFTLKEKDGQRYVELLRYSSGLTIEDYRKQLGITDGFKTAEEFLAHPIRIPSPLIAAEGIHRLLHRQHNYMETAEFEEIWQTIQPYIENYLLKKDGRSFNAVLNFADEVWENNKKRRQGLSFRDFTNYDPSYAERKFFEEKKVRQVGGGCPGKSGATLNKSLFSVSDFDSFSKDRGYDFDHEGICMVCNLGPRALGPCEICEECVVKIEKKEQFCATI